VILDCLTDCTQDLKTLTNFTIKRRGMPDASQLPEYKEYYTVPTEYIFVVAIHSAIYDSSRMFLRNITRKSLVSKQTRAD
jgi:hypothetical protein